MNFFSVFEGEYVDGWILNNFGIDFVKGSLWFDLNSFSSSFNKIKNRQTRCFFVFIWGLGVITESMWILDHNYIAYIAYLTKESLYFYHLDNPLYRGLAKRTCWVRWQLLIAILTHCIVPAGFEDHCPYIHIAESAVAVITLVWTPLFLIIIVVRLLFYSPLPKPGDNFPCYSDTSDSEEKNQEESNET